MNTYSPEELNLIADHLQNVLSSDTTFFLILSGRDKCGAIATLPPEAAPEIKAIMAELSQRETRFNN